MTNTTQPEALRLAMILDTPHKPDHLRSKAAAELRSQHARIADLEREKAALHYKALALEAQLSAIGAGGVESLRKRDAQQAEKPDKDAFVQWLSGTFPAVHNDEDALHYWKHGHVAALAWMASKSHYAAQPSRECLHQIAEPGSREAQMVVIKRGADGVPTVWCDPEIADIVRALNEGGAPTVASCSGHGEKLGSVALTEGRVLMIFPSLEEFTAAHRKLHPSPAQEHATQLAGQGLEDARDAARWREALRHVGGQRNTSCQTFGLVTLKPVSGNIMQGSVSEHFTKAIDAAMNAGGAT